MSNDDQFNRQLLNSAGFLFQLRVAEESNRTQDDNIGAYVRKSIDPLLLRGLRDPYGFVVAIQGVPSEVRLFINRRTRPLTFTEVLVG